jgi:hypothetical protein
MPYTGILGYSFARSVASLAPTQNFRHILPALQTYGLQGWQNVSYLSRYAQYFSNIQQNIF